MLKERRLRNGKNKELIETKLRLLGLIIEVIRVDN